MAREPASWRSPSIHHTDSRICWTRGVAPSGQSRSSDCHARARGGGLLVQRRAIHLAQSVQKPHSPSKMRICSVGALMVRVTPLRDRRTALM